MPASFAHSRPMMGSWETYKKNLQSWHSSSDWKFFALMAMGNDYTDHINGRAWGAQIGGAMLVWQDALYTTSSPIWWQTLASPKTCVQKYTLDLVCCDFAWPVSRPYLPTQTSIFAWPVSRPYMLAQTSIFALPPIYLNIRSQNWKWKSAGFRK